MTGNTHVFFVVLTISRVSEFAPPGIQHILSYAAGWLAALGIKNGIHLKENQELTSSLLHRLASFHCDHLLRSWLYYSSMRNNDHGL
jgi:hypothetical protein